MVARFRRAPVREKGQAAHRQAVHLDLELEAPAQSFLRARLLFYLLVAFFTGCAFTIWYLLTF